MIAEETSAPELRMLRDRFVREFGATPTHAGRAPGRVNIIGEHTDYNDGFVLPIALGLETVALGRINGTETFRCFAANLNQWREYPVGHGRRDPVTPWADYIIGVLGECARAGMPVPAADILIWGNVPIGCGLSSSASLEMAVLALAEALCGTTFADAQAARLGQRVENGFLGLGSGLMDQFICRAGRAGHAMLLDCRLGEIEHVPIGFESAEFMLFDSGVRRELTGSKYNERVKECAKAVAALNHVGVRGTHLRDCGLAELESAKESFPEVVYRRARHVISENARTLEAANALRSGDAATLGRLMTASHESLRADYEVSSDELDLLAHQCQATAGCLGARMTGAGFGGCVVALVETGATRTLAEQVIPAYQAQTGRTAKVIRAAASSGASRHVMD